jgi:hypothetical protein
MKVATQENQVTTKEDKSSTALSSDENKKGKGFVIHSEPGSKIVRTFKNFGNISFVIIYNCCMLSRLVGSWSV